MLHVNDDMDELFRKAGEEYPLNTASADWSAMRGKLNKGNDSNGKRRWIFFFLLMLVLAPLQIMFNQIDRNNNGRTTLLSAAATGTDTPAAKNEVKGNEEPQPSGNTRQKYVAVLSGKSKQSSFDVSISHKTATVQRNKPGKKLNNEQNENAKQSVNIGAVSTEGHDKTEDSSGEEFSKNVYNHNVSINDIPDSASLKETSVAKSDNDVKENKLDSVPGTKKKKQAKTRYLYAAIIAGPDVSTVKLQDVKKVGLGGGLIVGYRHKKWSLESGLLLDKKYYSTDGKYFSTKNIPLPGYVTIDHADGACDMFEIPVNIRYHFSSGYNGWSIAAGMSSYLMREEYYTYDITRYGVTYRRDFEYYEKRNSFMSVINLSGAYTFGLGKIGSLKIEPYLKLPVKKVGIGALPLQSAGIYLGFTRKLF